MKKEYKTQEDLDKLYKTSFLLNEIYQYYGEEIRDRLDQVNFLQEEMNKKVKEIQEKCLHDWEYHSSVYDSFYSCKICKKEKSR